MLAGIALLAAIPVFVAAHPRITTTITWSREISRIVDRRCVRCHRPDGEGPMSLTTWSEARPWAKAIKEEVLARRMPPWNAVRGYGAFANDPSLSPFEVDLIAAWADGGAPRGDDRDLPPTQPTQPLTRSQGEARPDVTSLALSCGQSAIRRRGVLMGLRPEGGEPAESFGVALRAPGRAPEILLLVRGYDPERRTTYWLAHPERVGRGTTLTVTSSTPGCRLAALISRDPQRQAH
ncbi:MAG TPA: hypothetical protein VHJ77_05605 [Vicinamibacterales bacterium]|nr:hypothetical protein [Vicinamibacterales bacterium]